MAMILSWLFLLGGAVFGDALEDSVSTSALVSVYCVPTTGTPFTFLDIGHTEEFADYSVRIRSFESIGIVQEFDKLAPQDVGEQSSHVAMMLVTRKGSHLWILRNGVVLSDKRLDLKSKRLVVEFAISVVPIAYRVANTEFFVRLERLMADER